MLKSNLMISGGRILSCLLVIILVACGSGGGEGNNGDSLTLPPDTSKSTQLIASYMNLIHKQAIDSFEHDLSIIIGGFIKRGWGYRGTPHSGAYDEYLSYYIQAFIISSLEYINDVKNTMAIDNNAIAEIFNGYRETDITYMEDGTTPLFDAAFVHGLSIKLNDFYAEALLHVEAL